MVDELQNQERFGVIGQTLRERYRVLRVIGDGGQAVVYEAEQLGLHRSVAIKFLDVKRLTALERSTALRRFEREAAILAELSHPSIVHVYDIATHADGETPFMVMEYVRGQSVAELLKLRQPTPWPRAFALIAQGASALATAHARQIIHRDTKPSNLMVSECGTLKVLDFGIAQLMRELSKPNPEKELTVTGQLIGTTAYMSPEQLEANLALDGRSDVYSLGLVLYRLLSTTLIWSRPVNDPHEILNLFKTEKPIDIKTRVPDLPDRAAQVVRRSLEFRREDRFPSMEAMHEALVGALDIRENSPTTPGHIRAMDLGEQPSGETIEVSAPIRSARPVLAAVFAIALLGTVVGVVSWRIHRAHRAFPSLAGRGKMSGPSRMEAVSEGATGAHDQSRIAPDSDSATDIPASAAGMKHDFDPTTPRRVTAAPPRVNHKGTTARKRPAGLPLTKEPVWSDAK